MKARTLLTTCLLLAASIASAELTHLLNTERKIGDASLVGPTNGQHHFEGTADGTLLGSNTDNILIVYQTTQIAQLANNGAVAGATSAMSNTWLFGIGGDTTSRLISARHNNSGNQRIQFYFDDGSATAASLDLNWSGSSPAPPANAQYYMAGIELVVVRIGGGSVTLGVVVRDQDSPSGYGLYSVTQAWAGNLQTLMGADGRLTIGNRYPSFGASADQRWHLSNFAIIGLSGTMAAAGFDTDAGLIELATETHKVLHRENEHIAFVRSYDLTDASGVRLKLDESAEIPAAAKLVEIGGHSDLTQVQRSGGTGLCQARAAYAPMGLRWPAQYSVGANPFATRYGDAIVTSTTTVNASNNGEFWLDLRDLAGDRIAPPVPLLIGAKVLESGQPTPIDYYGWPPSPPAGIVESHAQLDINIDSRAGRLLCQASLHQDERDNEPSTGDTWIATGCLHVLEDASPIDTHVFDYGSAGAGDRGTSYTANAVYGGDYFAVKRMNQINAGRQRLIRVDRDGVETISTLFKAPEAGGPTLSAYPTDMAVLPGGVAVVTGNARTGTTSTIRGGFGICYLLDLPNFPAAYYSRTGAAITPATADTHDAGLYPFPGPHRDQIDIATDGSGVDLSTLAYESQYQYRGILTHERDGDIYVGLFDFENTNANPTPPVTNADRRFDGFNLHVFRYVPGEFRLEYLHTHDLWTLKQQAQPGLNQIGTTITNDYQYGHCQVVHREGERCVLAAYQSSNVAAYDYTSLIAPHIGTGLGYIDITEWTQPTLVATASPTFLQASELGGTELFSAAAVENTDQPFMRVAIGVNAANEITSVLQPVAEKIVPIASRLPTPGGAVTVDNAAIASAVRAELAVELARIDVPISDTDPDKGLKVEARFTRSGSDIEVAGRFVNDGVQFDALNMTTVEITMRGAWKTGQQTGLTASSFTFNDNNYDTGPNTGDFVITLPGAAAEFDEKEAWRLYLDVVDPSNLPGVSSGNVLLSEEWQPWSPLTEARAARLDSAAQVSDLAALNGPVSHAAVIAPFLATVTIRDDDTLLGNRDWLLGASEQPVAGWRINGWSPYLRIASMTAPVSSDTSVVTVGSVEETDYGYLDDIAKVRLTRAPTASVGDTATVSTTITLVGGGTYRLENVVKIK